MPGGKSADRGGISEFRKIAAMFETHYQELFLKSRPALRKHYVDFRNGKLYLKNTPGTEVTFNKKTMTPVLEKRKSSRTTSAFISPRRLYQ